MPSTINVPDKREAHTKTARLSVSTGKGDEKKTQEFEADLPVSIADAIAMEGEKAVFRRYINALVVDLQAQQRNKLAPPTTGEGRKRAPYLAELGL